MALKAGTVEDFADSMARAMEIAFEQEWLRVKGVPLPGWGQEDRRLLLSAIAQGVVKHLKERAGEAFRIAVDTTQVTGGAGEPLVRSDNPDPISAGYGLFAPQAVQVRQRGGGDNMVKSRGTATVEEVVTDGRLY